MKKTLTLTTMALLAGAATCYSQGIVSMSDLNSYFEIQVFGPQSVANSTVAIVDGAYSGLEEMGDTANPNSANASGQPSGGTTVYSANNPLGTGYSMQLLAAAGTSVTAYSSLSPVGNSTGGSGVWSGWFSGSAQTGLGGFWNTGLIAKVPSGTSDTVALAAWNNEGGTITSLAAAQAAGDPWGLSAMETLVPATGIITPSPLSNPPITSFSLIATSVPEPSTIALGVMGASALLFRRRK
jgi:hypothetical protein